MTANLLSRLQGLTAPDREVDADIFQLLGGSEWDKAYIRAQEPCGCPHDLAVSTARERYSPAYTASLDAAVALCERVLPGWFWRAGRTSLFPNGWAYISRTHPSHCDREDEASCSDGRAATPAIALLIAILTALEAREAKACSRGLLTIS